uniref:Uncharacterized protein n=1 Tax=Eutreptiella gymnastica TaxID=73025 RepID=A0A7S1ISY8_9EUGL
MGLILEPLHIWNLVNTEVCMLQPGCSNHNCSEQIFPVERSLQDQVGEFGMQLRGRGLSWCGTFQQGGKQYQGNFLIFADCQFRTRRPKNNSGVYRWVCCLIEVLWIWVVLMMVAPAQSKSD